LSLIPPTTILVAIVYDAQKLAAMVIKQPL
jgi:hypothetical protein